MKVLKKCLIGFVLVGLLLNIGLSFDLKTDKDTYYCIKGVCDPVKITLYPDKADTYKIIITWETEKGDILTSALSTDLKTTLLTTDNYITYDKLALTTASTTYVWKFSAYGEGKFNISVYNSLNKLVYNLDPVFKPWVVNASAVYQNYTTGTIWDMTNQAFINYMNISGSVAIQNRGLVSNTSIGNFSAGYYTRSSLNLWNGTDSFSITLWIQRNSTGGGADNQYILSSDDDGLDLWISWVGSQNKFRFQTSRCDTLTDEDAYTLSASDAWTLITFIYDGTQNRCITYVNTTLSANSTASEGNIGKLTSFNVGIYSDKSGGKLVDFFINQLVLWNKSLTTEDITWFFNSGTGQETTEAPDDFLILTHQEPSNLTITSNPVNFSMLPVSSNNITSCSLYIDGVLNSTNTTITNNTAVLWSLNFVNGTYDFNYTCTGELRSNNTAELTLNVSVAYPYTPAPNISTIPDPYGEPTAQYCLDNSTLYIEYVETISYGGMSETYNRSKPINCAYGCENNQCNPAPFDSNLRLMVYLALLFACIALIVIIRKYL